MNMIEKVARAIDPEAFERWEDAYRRKDRWEQVNRIGALTAARERARGAIEAMREPSCAVEYTVDRLFNFQPHGGDGKRYWQRMIDAALKAE